MSVLVLGFVGDTLDEVKFDLSAWDINYDGENTAVLDKLANKLVLRIGDIFSLADVIKTKAKLNITEGITIDELFTFILHELNYPYAVKRVLSFDSCSFGALNYNGFKVVNGSQRILAEDLTIIDELLGFFLNKVMEEDIELNDRLPFISYKLKEIIRTYFGLEVEEEVIREYFRLALESSIDQRKHFGLEYESQSG